MEIARENSARPKTAAVKLLLNNKPGKCLNYLTPCEDMANERYVNV
jgi:IS30 family transposase